VRTLATLDHALLRPRFNGYLVFQDAAAPIVHHHLTNGGAETDLLTKLDRLLETARHLPAKGIA
jgi:multiple sugar transport system substrate-binding protein